MRLLDYLSATLKAFGRQPGRTGLTIMAMAISATILMTLAAVSLGLGDAATATLSPDANMSTVVVTPTRTAASASLFGGAQEVNQGSDMLTDDTLASLRGAPFVAVAVPVVEIWEFKTFQVDGSPKVFASQTAGIQSDPASNRPLAAGQYFAAGSTGQEAVVGYGYAKALGVQPGELVGRRITITTQNGYLGKGAEPPLPTASSGEWDAFWNRPTTLIATITGVLKQGADESRVYIPMGWARAVRTHTTKTINDYGQIVEKQEDFIAKDGYSSILAQAKSPRQVERVVDLAASLGVGAMSTLSQLKKVLQFATVIGVGLVAIAAVTLLAASLGIINTMLTAVAEQRYAIGVWRACGATKGIISRMFVLQAALMGLVGGLIGAGLSLLTVNIANSQLAGLLASQSLAAIRVATAPWWLLVGGVAVTVLFAVAAGLYPAWRAARQEPSLALSGGQ